MALHVLFLLIALIGGVIPGGLSLMTGIMGLANWIVGLVGLGLCIGGPSRTRGLAIAAVSVAAVHLVLAFIFVNDSESVQASNISIPLLSGFNRYETIQEKAKELQKEIQKNPGSARAKELQQEMKSYSDDSFDDGIGFGGKPSRSKMRWIDLSSQQPCFDKLLAILSYSSKSFSRCLLGVFSGLAELARLILLILLIGSLGGVVKDYGAQSKAKIGWIAAASAAGAGLLIILLCFVIMDSGSKDVPKDLTKVSNPFRWFGVGEFLVFALHAGVLVMPALAAWQIFSTTGAPKSPKRDRGRERDRDRDDRDDRDRTRKRRHDDDDDED
jgi:hypothetical protein